ncbi:MAG: InlB B-repeat-containing protein, partial [Lachnospiraceae bacterium]|nr:InlB B-repeat-containing protein [Lachnospiraceae bacterium]
FKGWYKDAGFGTAFDFNAVVTEDTVIYAKWIEKIPEPKTFTVTFSMNGHGTAPKAQTVTEGKTAEKPEDPAAEGWEFKGWYKDAGFGTAFDFNAAVTEDTVIYANWTEIWKPIADTDDSANITAVLFTGTWNNPVSSGIWKQDINDRWFYSTEAVFRNTWAYIVNPYARDGQNRADWFWFDKNGKMLTGWQYINGKWYYLNPNSDGTLGACFTGPGKTPDGYEVDSSGAWIG